MIRWLVDRTLTVTLAILAVFAFGLWAYLTLPRESAPDITIPVVMVTTPYPGVSPKDVEGLLTIPIEQELASLRDVKEMASTSMEGVSLISVEFEPNVVMEDALQRVRDRVSKARPDLPDDAKEPEIREISFSDIPILLVNIYGDRDEQELLDLGEDLQDAVTRIPGVLDAKLTGGLERELHVDVDPWRLAHYGLAMGDVISAVQRENASIPGGEVSAGQSSFLVRVPGEIEAARELEDVAIDNRGDRPVFIRDVARVTDGYAERATYARLNGRPTVTLSVTKRTGANIVEVASQVRDEAAAHAAAWPEGVGYRVVNDQSVHIEDMVTELQNNIITALLLVVAVLLFFMGLRNSLFVAFAIPASMLMSMLVLQALGFTLNMIVLFSLILALGMLVDNAIVVVENVYRHMEMGKTRHDAAIDGTREVAIPVAASTATTVAAFLPLVFWGGIMGQFMGYLPKTVIIVLTASLVVAVAVLPAGLSRFLKAKRQGPAPAERAEPGFIMRQYRAVLQASIRWRYAAAGLGFLTLLVTFGAYALLQHGVELFPSTEPNRATIAVELPEGSDLEATDRMVRQVENLLATEPNVLFYVAETGVEGGGSRLASAQSLPHKARISVEFLPHRSAAAPGEPTRVEPTPDTIDRIRERLGELTGAHFEIAKERMGPPVGMPIALQVTGDDFHTVGQFAEVVRRRAAEIEGTTDLTDNYKVGRPELRLRVDRGAAKRVGVSTSEVGNAVRSSVAGTVASTLRDGEDEVDILVRLAPEYRDDLQAILDLRLPGREGRGPNKYPVPISSVATYQLLGGTGNIHHIDQDLVVSVEGDVVEGANEVAVRKAVMAAVAELDHPDGVTVSLAGAQDAQDEAQAFILRAFFIAIAGIMLVLVTQFNSLTTPLIIIASVTLSLIGVLWGLILTATPFGIIMTGVGVISLAGVVVNNAIVLLDYVELLRRQGMDVHEALVEAGMTRFRPVMLTAVTTVLGLVPMALGISLDLEHWRIIFGSPSADWWGPMANAVIFGLVVATVLTLVMVPTFYSINHDLELAWGWVRGKLTHKAAAVATTSALALLLLPGDADAVTLDEAFQAAESHDVTVAILAEQTLQSRTLRGKAWSAVSPQLSAQGGLNFNQYEVAFDPTAMLPEDLAGMMGDPGEPIVIQPKQFWSGSVTASQALFNGPAIPALRAAYAMGRGAELDEARKHQQVKAGVARAYYSLWSARESLAVSEAALDSAQGHLELASRQVAAGSAPQRSALQAELSVSRAERDLTAARARLVEAEEAWFRTTGLPRDAELAEPETPSVPASLDEALALAADRRPDLRASQERQQAMRLQARAYHLDWLPQVNGSFTYLYSENTGFSDHSHYWVASVTANWRLWDGGYRIAQEREAASQARVARLVVEQTSRQADEEVATAWAALQRAQSAYDAVEHEVELARENLRMAERAFSAGSATWLEVEEAELTVSGAELSRVMERMGRDLAAVQLNVAVGTW